MTARGVGILFMVSLLAASFPAFSQLQPYPGDVAASVASASKAYAEAFPVHPQLYNGPEYKDYSKAYHAQTGHQFFLSPDMQPGSAFYNGHAFANVQLLYDVVLDQVVLSPPQSPLTLSLINENVREFSISGHRFTRLLADSSGKGVIRTGFYEVLLDGTVQVLAKRTKHLQRIVRQFDDVEFITKDAFFIKKAGIYASVSRKSAAMRLFADRGKEMQEYLKNHPLSFKKAAFENALVQLASHYNSLPPR